MARKKNCKTCTPDYHDVSLEGVPCTIEFVRERLWTPPEHRSMSVKYLTGKTYTVRRDWALAMIADGDAIEVIDPVLLKALGNEDEELEVPPEV